MRQGSYVMPGLVTGMGCSEAAPRTAREHRPIGSRGGGGICEAPSLRRSRYSCRWDACDGAAVARNVSAPIANPAGFLASPACRLADAPARSAGICQRSEEHTSELQSLMRSSYAVFCL